MIQPIIIPSSDHSSFREYRQNNLGTYFVFFQRDRMREVSLGLICDNGDHFSGWSIILWESHTNYKIGEMTVRKEECLDFIAKTYPEHFEWIIWNLDLIK